MAGPTPLRSSWQFAAFGIVSFAVCSAILATCRACGLLEFRLEWLPAALIFRHPPSSSSWIDWIVFYGLGALLGIGYRFAFTCLRHGSWRAGAILGLVQWLGAGLLIALLEPLLNENFTVLPTKSILEPTHGIMIGAFIILLNCLFGGILGSFAATPKTPDFEAVEFEATEAGAEAPGKHAA